MGKRIELDIVYRPKPGNKKQPVAQPESALRWTIVGDGEWLASEGSSETAAPQSTSTPPKKARGSTRDARATAKPTSADTAQVGILEAVKAKSSPKRSAKPKVKKAKRGRPRTGFNRTEYMKLYMRDKTQADKVGMTVKAWRGRQKEKK